MDHKKQWKLLEFLNLGHVIRPFDMAIHSSVPVGSGLSSSAALEVAVATALEAHISHEDTVLQRGASIAHDHAAGTRL